MSLPSNVMRPPTETMPLMAFRVVVLPAPLAPRMPTASFSPTVSEMPCSTRAWPYDAVTSSSCRRLIRDLLPEVGLDDPRVGLRLGGGALHELRTVVEHDDPI